jgi:hypothetical protein
MHSKTSSRLRGAAVLLAGALALTACGGEASADRDAAASSAPVSNESAAPTTPAAPKSRVEPAVVAPAEFSGPAVDQFGPEAVQAAYALASQFAAETSFKEDLLGPDPNRTVADFEFATKHMTPGDADSWRSMVQATLDGDMQQANQLMTFAFNDTIGPDMAFPTSGPIVRGHTIGNPRASIGGHCDLTLAIDEYAQFRFSRNGTPLRMDVNKTVDYHLEQNGDGWLICGMDGRWTTGAEIPE